jgi:hypothetical protein
MFDKARERRSGFWAIAIEKSSAEGGCLPCAQPIRSDFQPMTTQTSHAAARHWAFVGYAIDKPYVCWCVTALNRRQVAGARPRK